jgi:hypothetical protein
MPGMHGGIAGAVVQESNDYKHPPTPRTPAEDTPAARFKRLPKDDVLFLERLFSEFDVDESGGLGREQTGALIRRLNDGVAPTDEELDDVMREAAGDDGIVFVDELADVLKSWHRKVEAKRVAREGKKPQKSDGAVGSCAIS